MQYRYLGRSALKVSPLCLGAMMFGGQTDEATSHRIIRKARERGVNFIDTANVYNGGRSEEVVGRAIRDHREDWVLATKLGNATAPGAGPNEAGLSRKWIVQSTEQSLRRLGVDYVDLMFFHRLFPRAPLGESIGAVADLIRQGKIRYFGVSNFPAWRLAEVARLAADHGIDGPVATQPLYNMVDRKAEVEHLPAAAHFGVGVTPYSPLARGVLSGKYAPDAPPDPTTRAGRGDRRIHETEWRPESLRIAQAVVEHARQRGVTPVAFAIGWVLANRTVSSAIVGPRTEEQWDAYLPALDVALDAEDERFVDALVPPGHASTWGYSDPGYPIEGRPLG